MPIAIIVVSDGSTDGTGRVVSETNAIYVELPRNQGKGAALRAGLARAVELPFQYLITMDGDGQHDPGDLEQLLRPVVHGGYDATFGSRYLKNTTCGKTPINRFWVRRATVAYLKRTLGMTFTDPFCGYRCFSRSALEKISFTGNAYHSELEAIFDACIHRLRVVEVPVKKIYGTGMSKMGNHGGPILGRIRVLGQYLSTVRRKSCDLRGMRTHHPDVYRIASTGIGVTKTSQEEGMTQ
jgi:glycosyltransferase involved in cell wall biosynthesis